MSLRRKLFRAWCGFAVAWWLFGIFGDDGNLIVLKFERGGWRGAYVHLAVTIAIALGVPLVVLLIGRTAFWIRDRKSSADS
jgi:hypothetical protein